MANETAVAPPDNATNAVQAAIATGDIGALKAVAPRVSGTSLSPVVNDAVSNMDKAVAPAARVINTANANGGIATADGRLATADAIAAEYKKFQPPTGVWQGIAQGLMGNKEWSKAMTPGNVVPAIVAGKDGRAYTAIYNQNSKIPTAVFDENQQPVPLSEWMKQGAGLYQNITDTPGYIQGKLTTEAFTKANNDEQSALNNAVAMFGNVINPRNEQNMQALLQLKKSKAELPNSILNEIASKTSLTGSNANSFSENYSNIQQANDVTSLNDALDKSKKAGLDLGVPGVVAVNADGTIKTSDGKTTTKNDLLSKVKGGSSSTNVEKGWTTAREQIVKGELYKQLDMEQKALVDLIMNNQQAMDIAKASYVQKHGWPSVLSPSAPYQPGQTLNSNIANTFIDAANLEHAQQAQKQLDSMLSRGLPIVPGSAAAAYSQGREANATNAKYAEFMKQALSLPTPAEATPAPTPAAKPVAPMSTDTFAPGQSARLGQTSKLDTGRVNEAGAKVDKNAAMSSVLQQFLKNKGVQNERK